MFKIYDGREKFYQWDLDRKLIVEDPTIKEVHFCNRTGECSLVCETYVEDGITLANVPNVLLQTDWKIRVFGYTDNHTKFDGCFEVVSRTKPEDYIYTDEELKTWEELQDQINDITKNSSAIQYHDLGHFYWDDERIDGDFLKPEFLWEYLGNNYGVHLIAFDNDWNYQYVFVTKSDYNATDELYLEDMAGNRYCAYIWYDWDDEGLEIISSDGWQNISPYTKTQVDDITNNLADEILGAVDASILDSQYYMEEYVAQELAAFDFIKIVDVLPDVGLPNKIYLVPKNDSDSMDLFDEFIWIAQIEDWEYISTKQLEVDMTNYVPKTAFNYDATTQTLNINIV